MEASKGGSPKQIFFRSFLGILVAILDAAVQSGVIYLISQGGLAKYYFKNYTYQSSTAEMASYSIFRSLLLFLASLLTLVDSTEYPKRFREMNHFVLVINGLLALSILAKILAFYGAASFVSWLFWGNCSVSLFFCVLHPIMWRYVSRIDPKKEDKFRTRLNFMGLEASRSSTFMESRTTSVIDGGSVAVEKRLSQVEKMLEKNEKESILEARKLIGLSYTDTLTLIMGVICSIVSAVCEVFIPYSVAKIVYNIFLYSKDADRDALYEEFREWSIIGGSLMLGKSILILLRTTFISRAKDRLQYKIQSVLFKKMLQEQQQFFDKRSVDSLMQRMTSDVESTVETITEACISFIRSFVKSIIVFFFLLIYISWELSFVMLGVVPVLIYITINYTTNVNTLRTAIDTSLDQSLGHVSECFRKVKTLKQFGTEKYEAYRFKEGLKAIDGHRRKLSYRVGIFKGSLSLIQVAFLFAIMFYGGHLVMSHILSGEQFIIFTLMHVDMIEGIEEIGRSFTEIVQNYLWALRLTDTMKKLYKHSLHKCDSVHFLKAKRPKVKGQRSNRDNPHGYLTEDVSKRVTNTEDIELRLLPNVQNQYRPTTTPYRPEDIVGAITFENVQFSYQTSKRNQEHSVNALHNISFSVEPGQIVALVGKSGCGKSTCLRLMSRMYRPRIGRILLDGRSIEDYERCFFHEKVVLVSSEIELLNRSIKENIQYGIMGASDIDLMSAAKMSNAHHYLEEFYDHWDTKVEYKVSSNKEHKLFLGRALIRKPKVVLIDEVAMRLDAEVEELFERQLLRSRRETNDNEITYAPTILIIAHKLSTIQKADKIIVLDNGRVVGEGTHSYLIESNPFYLELVQKQMNVISSVDRQHAKPPPVVRQRSFGTIGNVKKSNKL